MSFGYDSFLQSYWLFINKKYIDRKHYNKDVHARFRNINKGSLFTVNEYGNSNKLFGNFINFTSGCIVYWISE